MPLVSLFNLFSLIQPEAISTVVKLNSTTMMKPENTITEDRRITAELRAMLIMVNLKMQMNQMMMMIPTMTMMKVVLKKTRNPLKKKMKHRRKKQKTSNILQLFC